MTIPGLGELLYTFDPIDLSQMDKVRLMNRIDVKYVLSANKVLDLLSSMNRYYKILEINDMRLLSYSTTYFDTSDYLFFKHHVTGKLERYKIRYRTYNATNKTFLEVKIRTNKNRTIKKRIENPLPIENKCDEKATKFIEKYISMDSLKLKPVLINRFNRITLIGSDSKERVTIDSDLSFSASDGKRSDLPFLTIVELKRDSGSNRSMFAKALKDLYIRPTGFSKYCMGISLLYDLPRKNVIKPKLLLINKIENEFNNHVCA